MRPERRRADNYPNHVAPPDPIGDRRLSGAHWWDPDRIRHVEDMPNHCPSCGKGITEAGGIAIEYWESDERHYHVWCHGCGWTGNITRVRRMVGHEADH